jgi:hypothetical protein
MEILYFDNLTDYIKNYIKNNSTIIYFGIGTMFYSNNRDNHDWEYKNNQQFPPFLCDAKNKFLEINILIILIDPAFEYSNSPYIVNDCKNFLNNSWSKSLTFINLYESTLGVNVIYIKKGISWDNLNNDEFFNIKPLIIDLCEFISNPEIDALLFYHEFTGKNVIRLEQIIKKSKINNNNIVFDNNKICIDITRGADLSCYFNLTDPENYPIIIFDNNKLKYLNLTNFSNIEIKEIVSKHKKFTFDSNNNEKIKIFDKNETNFLIDKSNELIIYFQIIKSDEININLILNSIVTTIRQFYTITNYNLLGMNMWGVKFFENLQVNLPFLNFDNIYKFLKIIDEYHQIYSHTNKNTENEIIYFNSIDEIKIKIINELYLLLKNSLEYIIEKYITETSEIDEIINLMKNSNNKYDIIKLVKNFINCKIL